MRPMKQVIPAACTALLLIVGCVLPSLTARLLDIQLARQITKWEDASVTLALFQSTDFFDTMTLISSQHVEIVISNGYQMTREEAQETAAEAVKLFPFFYLSTADIPYGKTAVPPITIESENNISNPEVIPILMTSKLTPTLSGVFWRCTWPNTFGSNSVLWLDDETERVVAFQSGIHEAITVKPREILEQMSELLPAFLRSYYPIDDVLVVQEPYLESSTRTIVLARGGENANMVQSTIAAEELKTHSVSLYLRGNTLYFNL